MGKTCCHFAGIPVKGGGKLGQWGGGMVSHLNDGRQLCGERDDEISGAGGGSVGTDLILQPQMVAGVLDGPEISTSSYGQRL